jgi:hypothetical protein
MLLYWHAVVFIVVAGVSALIAFIVARDTESVVGNTTAFATGIVMTAILYIAASMVIDHTLTVDLRRLFNELASSTLVAPFAGAALGLWWARQYRQGR